MSGNCSVWQVYSVDQMYCRANGAGQLNAEEVY